MAWSGSANGCVLLRHELHAGSARQTYTGSHVRVVVVVVTVVDVVGACVVGLWVGAAVGAAVGITVGIHVGVAVVDTVTAEVG